MDDQDFKEKLEKEKQRWATQEGVDENTTAFVVEKIVKSFEAGRNVAATVESVSAKMVEYINPTHDASDPE